MTAASRALRPSQGWDAEWAAWPLNRVVTLKQYYKIIKKNGNKISPYLFFFLIWMTSVFGVNCQCYLLISKTLKIIMSYVFLMKDYILHLSYWQINTCYIKRQHTVIIIFFIIYTVKTVRFDMHWERTLVSE